MKRTTIFLDEATDRDLKSLAYRRNEPVAQLVREALGRYVVEETASGPALPSFVGAFASGHSDTAERHEELLFSNLVAELDAQRLPPSGTRRVRRKR